MAVSPLQSAWTGLTRAMGVVAREHQHLDDLVAVDTTSGVDRLQELVDLQLASESGNHLLLGGTLTFRRKQTGRTLCMAVGVSDAPPFPNPGDLLSWQYGIWCDGLPGFAFTSPIYALPPESANFLVLEELRLAADDALKSFIEECSMTNRAFISYVREDGNTIDRLCKDLGRFGLATWTDRSDIGPGVLWKDAIRGAIQNGSAFIACFSTRYAARTKTYMNEELLLAVEELRVRPRDRAWFFPILLDNGSVPAIPIRPGETLNDLQSVSLAMDWDIGVGRLARAIRDVR